MKISNIHIENFRSIKTLTICPQDICALVGENNAGKTNILSGLNFLLGETWPTKRSLDSSDYYNGDTSRPIYIQVDFADNEHGIHSIWCQAPWDGKVGTQVEYRSGRRSFLTHEIRERCALVYLDANRNLEYHLGNSRWTLFGRIVRHLDEDFRQNVPQAHQEALRSHFERTLDYLRTEMYTDFESTFTSSFRDQLRRTNHSIKVEFQTFDSLNYYRSVQPILIEDGKYKNPSEAGQGMRNLILLALFRSYAKVFRGDAIIAVEEPEIYLHPHAQRSLSALFNELAEQGNQVFYSTHSGNFIDVEHFDRICLVEKCADNEDELCTKVQQVSASELLAQRQKLYPEILMHERSLKERYHRICRLNHSEAFFGRKILLVEGETEELSLPIYADALGYNFDVCGVSVVNAQGKHNLDILYQLYDAFGIPIYIIFDNDRGGEESALAQNELLLKMLGISDEREPDGVVGSGYAILEGNFEEEIKKDLNSIMPGKYGLLSREAKQELGASAGKGLIARYMAQRLTDENMIPTVIGRIMVALQNLGEKSGQEESYHLDSRGDYEIEDLYGLDAG